jgi:hypothetical protein
MRKTFKMPKPGPCRTLPLEARRAIERQLRAQGRLLPASEEELELLRQKRRRAAAARGEE